MDGLLLTAVLPLVAFVLLTAGNAFFVAAEFALVTVDRAEIDRAGRRGRPPGPDGRGTPCTSCPSSSPAPSSASR